MEAPAPVIQETPVALRGPWSMNAASTPIEEPSKPKKPGRFTLPPTGGATPAKAASTPSEEPANRPFCKALAKAASTPMDPPAGA
eukprot:CAMPEP_0169075894 /NCGR_PEP_ID=MMETSP1015-20121227/8061_1 /TAXON_ID=342587 /ORGANISM="Karlodinium micrum, Strain CCMP2283" /LENGTH=84 /DNA_ID=CAMNT_0009135327 /DNA_START=1232 /DNA_END=1486 /DNA_ORIENTATION=-